MKKSLILICGIAIAILAIACMSSCSSRSGSLKELNITLPIDEVQDAGDMVKFATINQKDSSLVKVLVYYEAYKGSVTKV